MTAKDVHDDGHPKGVHGTDAPTLRFDNGEWPDWRARLESAVAATLAGRAARRHERAAFAERRSHGLRARHSAKLARNRSPRGTTEVRTPGSSDAVSNESPSPVEPQVRASSPDGKTGTERLVDAPDTTPTTSPNGDTQ